MSRQNLNIKKYRRKLQAARSRRYYQKFGLIAGVVIVGILLVNLVAPDKSYSVSEKRNLSQFPKLTLVRIVDGSFMDEMEDYEADQFFLRSQWMTLRTTMDRLVGKNESQGVYLGKNSNLMERFNAGTEESRQAITSAVKAFAERYPDVKMSFLLVPNAVSIESELLPKDALTDDQNAYLDAFFGELGDSVQALDVREALKTAAETTQVYYRTDHHWTTDGAYAAFLSVADALGVDGSRQFASKTVCNDFSGSLAAKSGFYVREQDAIHIFTPMEEDPMYVVNFEDGTQRATCYDADALKGEDPYQVFFGGNQGKITIETSVDTNCRLLVLKDSYANCFLPFLLSEFQEITIVDPRYYYENLNDLMVTEQYTDMLYLYNVNTLAEDTNLSLTLAE